MKQITQCIICHRPLAQRLGYQAEKVEWITNPITGKKEKQVIEGLICPPCNKRMGYKTSKDKLERFRKAMMTEGGEDNEE